MDTRKKYWQHSTRGDLTFDQVRASSKIVPENSPQLVATSPMCASLRLTSGPHLKGDLDRVVRSGREAVHDSDVPHAFKPQDTLLGWL